MTLPLSVEKVSAGQDLEGSERGGKGGNEAASINSDATVLCVVEPEPLGAVRKTGPNTV